MSELAPRSMFVPLSRSRPVPVIVKVKLEGKVVALFHRCGPGAVWQPSVPRLAMRRAHVVVRLRFALIKPVIVDVRGMRPLLRRRGNSEAARRLIW